MLQKVLGATTMLSRDAGRARFGAQATTQKALKQRVQTILFTAGIAGDGHKHVAALQRRQRNGTLHIQIKARASLNVDSIQQSQAGQELLSLRPLCRQYFFRKILEDVAL